MPYRVIRLTSEHQNIIELAAEGMRWAQTVQEHKRQYAQRMITWDEYARSEFAGEALMTSINYLRSSAMPIVACVGTYGRLLGVMQYDLLVGGTNEYYIGLLFIDPSNMRHHQFYEHFRGIGTGMVASVVANLMRHGATRVCMHPLDRAAKAFWNSRGFRALHESAPLCANGRTELANVVRVCNVQPDCPLDGDCVECSKNGSSRAAIKHAIAGLVMPKIASHP